MRKNLHYTLQKLAAVNLAGVMIWGMVGYAGLGRMARAAEESSEDIRSEKGSWEIENSVADIAIEAESTVSAEEALGYSLKLSKAEGLTNAEIIGAVYGGVWSVFDPVPEYTFWKAGIGALVIRAYDEDGQEYRDAVTISVVPCDTDDVSESEVTSDGSEVYTVTHSDGAVSKITEELAGAKEHEYQDDGGDGWSRIYAHGSLLSVYTGEDGTHYGFHRMASGGYSYYAYWRNFPDGTSEMMICYPNGEVTTLNKTVQDDGSTVTETVKEDGSKVVETVTKDGETKTEYVDPNGTVSQPEEEKSGVSGPEVAAPSNNPSTPSGGSSSPSNTENTNNPSNNGGNSETGNPGVTVDPTQPTQAETTPTEAVPTEPTPTEPEYTEPTQAEPAPTDPAPTEQETTESAPTDPVPTEPAQTDPAPTEPAPTEPEPTQPQAPSVDDYSSSLCYEILDLINAERANEGLTAYTWGSELDSGTLLRAKELNISYSHTRPDGSSGATAYPVSQAEDIAFGYGSASSVLAAWMESEGHRAPIMADCNGYISCAYSGGYWVLSIHMYF